MAECVKCEALRKRLEEKKMIRIALMELAKQKAEKQKRAIEQKENGSQN